MKNYLKKLIFCVSIFSLMQLSINAQNEVDALRFSETDWQGSARFMGVGRAFGAVGAEFSALSINPASIGLYKKHEVTFTPLAITINKSSSEYNRTNTSDQKVKYSLNNAGIVFAIPGGTSWKKFQIGFGYNRIMNFNNSFSIKGRSNGKTIGDLFAFEANKMKLNYKDYLYWPSDELYIGWLSYLIDTIPGSETSYLATLSGHDLKQSSTVTRTGGNDEMVFSFGTNFEDKLFLGATLGVPFINFTENRTYMEENDKDPYLHVVQSFKMTDKLSVRATGINLKLGVIYQPVNFLRLGLAFHTPTYYGKVKENYDRKFYARILGGEVIPQPDDYTTYPGHFNYSLTTPLRAMLNTAFFIKQRAFISAEYEIVDYSMARMYADPEIYDFDDLDYGENNYVKNMYGVSHIARIGAEVNVNQTFAVRAGYNYSSSPYKTKINDGSKHYASIGFGFRTKYFYSDFAYALTISKEKYWMYDALFTKAVDQKFLAHRIILTMGVRF